MFKIVKSKQGIQLCAVSLLVAGFAGLMVYLINLSTLIVKCHLCGKCYKCWHVMILFKPLLR